MQRHITVNLPSPVPLNQQWASWSCWLHAVLIFMIIGQMKFSFPWNTQFNVFYPGLSLEGRSQSILYLHLCELWSKTAMISSSMFGLKKLLKCVPEYWKSQLREFQISNFFFQGSMFLEPLQRGLLWNNTPLLLHSTIPFTHQLSWDDKSITFSTHVFCQLINDFLVHCSSLSSVTPPDIWYRLMFPNEVIDNCYLSALQLEAVVYACQQHETFLADGTRAGFLIGNQFVFQCFWLKHSLNSKWLLNSQDSSMFLKT